MTALARKASKAIAVPLGWPGRRRDGDIVILLYHRVGPTRREIELPADIFAEHLRYLAERHPIVTLDDVVAGSHGGGVVVTFDDGTPDFHETVLPLVVEHRVPTHLYLATGLVAGQGATRAEGLTWSQLSEAIGTGLVTVGSHTHAHADLSRADERTAEEEMHRSRSLVEENLGRPCRHFAYPWGVGSAGADRAARRLFVSAALDGWRTNRAGRTDPHRLGRVPILRSDGSRFFRAKVKGWLNPEGWLYRAAGRGPWSRS